MARRHGGQILVDQLKQQGVTRVFSVPGESFLAALDGLHGSDIENIVCRHEGGAAMMAEAHGKLTGRPGVCFVTRGPGATNASSGIHVAMQDSTPMVMFVGQIARGHRDRGAFQEVDYRAFFAPLAKWVAEVDRTERLPEYISRAFHVARSGRPGPVVLALPEDMLSATADVPDIAPANPAEADLCPAQAGDIMARLAAAARPLVVVGGQWSARTAADLRRFAEMNDLPVAADFRRQDYMDNRSRCYVGDLGVGMNPKLAERMRNADCLLVIGARLGDIATAGYELVNPAVPHPAILHIHPDPDEPGTVYRPALAAVATPENALIALCKVPPVDSSPWAAWRRAARAGYEAWRTPQESPGMVKLEEIVLWLSDNLPRDTILANGAGNYGAWLHRYFLFREYGTQLAPTSGSMGYGFPAAIAASLQHPERMVVCLAGDGDFQMTLNELSTAIQHDARPIVIVANNGRYGTIRMHQEKRYPGRVSGTDLANPDFAVLVRAYGGHGEAVERTADFAPAFARARESGTVAVIELRLDPEALATGMTLSEARRIGETGG